MRTLIHHSKQLLKSNRISYNAAVKAHHAYRKYRAKISHGAHYAKRKICNGVPIVGSFAQEFRARNFHSPVFLFKAALVFFPPFWPLTVMHTLLVWMVSRTERPDPLLDLRTSFTIFYPEKAKALNLFPGPIHAAIKRKDYIELARVFYSLGDWSFHFGYLKQAVILWGYGVDWLKIGIAEKYPESVNSGEMIFTSQYYTVNIGHIPILEDIIKLSILGLLPKNKFRVYVHPDFMCNRFYYDKLAPYVETLPYPEDLATRNRIETMQENLYFAETVKGRLWCYHFGALADVRWNEAGRPPLMTLTKDEQEAGYKNLASLGLDSSRGFVTLHVRGAKYRNTIADNTRNVTLDNYGAAVDYIRAAGVQVVVMGEPGVRIPESLTGKIIDYANSSIRSPETDIFLTAMCRFFLGTSTGISHPSRSFGVPAIFANLSPPNSRPYYKGQMWVPKLIWSISKKRYLTLAEMMQPPYGLMYRPYLQKRHGVIVHDNSAEDLQDAVMDMFDILAGKTPNDRALQSYVDSTDPSCPPVPYPSRLSPRFARRHREILGLPKDIFDE